MKLLKVLFVAAIVVAIAAPTFAAVQNIKVSGSIEERAIFMNNFDLMGESNESGNVRWPGPGGWGPTRGSGASINSDSGDFVLSTITVGVDSDLTDNISASIVLANQTRWGENTNFSDVDVNKAFITMKEFFYQPLTIKIGRQDLAFGDGLIVGPGILRDPTGTFAIPRTDLVPNRFDIMDIRGLGDANNNYVNNISGPLGQQYTISTYYDALRAILDLDPWTVDAIWASIDDSSISGVANGNRDEDLLGTNVAYKFDSYNAKAEGFYFYKNDRNFNSDLGYIDPVEFFNANNNGAAIPILAADPNQVNFADLTVAGVGARQYEKNVVHVIGMRGDIEPVENLSLSGEGAYQWGKLYDTVGTWNLSTNNSELERKRSAWAIDVSGNYLWKEVEYKPNLGLGFVLLSGEESGNAGKFNGWDPMFKGKFYSMIRDYMAGTGAAWDGVGGNLYQTLDTEDPAGSTNNMTLYVDGGLRPMEDLSLKARYLHFWAEERVAGRGRSIGDEVDASLVYDYTEDVKFDLTGGIFIPGALFEDNTDTYTYSVDNAVILTTGVKVAF